MERLAQYQSIYMKQSSDSCSQAVWSLWVQDWIFVAFCSARRLRDLDNSRQWSYLWNSTISRAQTTEWSCTALSSNNSPALARELKVRGFDCVGTLRTNRQFSPFESANISKKDVTVGQVVGCTSWDVKSHAAFIPPHHGVSITKCGETLKPTIVRD